MDRGVDGLPPSLIDLVEKGPLASRFGPPVDPYTGLAKRRVNTRYVMSYEIKAQGRYEIHRVPNGDRYLLLDGRAYAITADYFTISEGSQGDLWALSEDDFEVLTSGGADETLERVREGSYKLVHFEKEEDFQNIPYLFLEWNGKYEELYIPDGLPENPNDEVRFIYTDHTIRADSLESYLATTRPRGEDLAEAAEDEPPVEDYFDLTAHELAMKIRAMEPAQLRQLESYEAQHKNRTTGIDTIRNQLRN
jgi:hypothetical protein